MQSVTSPSSPGIRAIVLAVTGFGVAAQPAAASEVIATQLAKVRLETVAAGLEHPWGMAFLPDGRMLVTERPGRLRVIGRDGRLGPPLSGVPRVEAVKQGGLLDVVLDPDFPETRLVYLSYAEPRDEGKNGTAVAQGPLWRRPDSRTSRSFFASNLR